MRLSLVDWLAVGIAGRNEPVARLTRAMVLDEGGAGQASLFGGGKAPLRSAALVNGAASHALDYDDTHFAHIGHPSVAVIPAALCRWQISGPRDRPPRACGPETLASDSKRHGDAGPAPAGPRAVSHGPQSVTDELQRVVTGLRPHSRTADGAELDRFAADAAIAGQRKAHPAFGLEL